MSPNFPGRGLYCLTSASLAASVPHEAQARGCVEGGAAIVQLRAKRAADAALVSEARRMAVLCRNAGGAFIVNDDPGLALEANADGVHLGQNDVPPDEARRVLGPNRIVGLSTHTRRQVLEAAAAPVDYIGFGPIFASGSKTPEYSPRGLGELAWAVRSSRVPVVPIGGIALRNLPGIVAAGARHAAVIAGVVEAPDIAAAARAMVSILAPPE